MQKSRNSMAKAILLAQFHDAYVRVLERCLDNAWARQKCNYDETSQSMK